MKERPIIFSTEMVRAILDGRKTQTRRVIKPQPDITANTVRDDVFWSTMGLGLFIQTKCPYGQPGDLLYVRETWGEGKYVRPKISDKYIYRADGAYSAPWRPSIHMPKAAARIWLEITDIRVERVQEISETDSQREGWNLSNHPITETYDPVIMDTARRWFSNLWDSINAKRGYFWESNPWIWVIEFKRIDHAV